LSVMVQVVVSHGAGGWHWGDV